MEPDETLGLVILSSDKTHLTVGQGDKECHAVYMSCGNIKKTLRTKVGAHCWMMIAQVPIAKFEPSRHQGLLTNRLLHLCLDIVLAGLKRCAATAEDMVDPNGSIRSVRTFLAAYIADLPEQQALACVRSGYAPSSLAEPSSLGDSAAHGLRRGSATLEAIQEIMDELGEDDSQDYLRLFEKAAKGHGLNGVDKPFWRDWLHSDPSLFLAPDALHQWHKLFMDHPIEWAKTWLGDEEFDRRLSVLQPRIGFRHFRDGFTRFRQHTGKETKDLERVFLAVIAGHPNVTAGIMKAMRAFLDFVYLAQYESHSTATLRYLRDALKDFHRYKHHIADSGVRSGTRRNDEFHIPKIELMQHVQRLVELLGTAPQFSSEQTERCHIDMAKQPYKATNRKEYSEQMCRYLDRDERIRMFSALTEWHSTGHATANECEQEKKERFQQLVGRFLPSPVRNIFQAKNPLLNATTAFQLHQKPDAKGLLLRDVQLQYEVPNLIDDLCRYFLGSRAQDYTSLPFSSLDIWWRVRVQLKDPQDSGALLPSQTIQASPRMKTRSAACAGRYNFVLLHRDAVDDSNGNSDSDYGIQGEALMMTLFSSAFSYVDLLN